MNFIRIFDNCFWGDEYYSIRLARMSINGLIQATAGDVHPPLYYIWVKVLYRLLGDTSVIYHFSGFFPYALMIVTAYAWGKKRLGLIATIVMITMSSLMPIAVTENVEVRMYSLAAFFVYVSYISLYEIINYNKPGGWSIFCIASLGAAYSHYYALISVAFFYVVLIFLSIKMQEYRCKASMACTVTVVGYLPWFFKLLSAFQRNSNNWWLNGIPTIGECIRYLFKYKWLNIIFFVVLFIFAFNQFKEYKLKMVKEIGGVNLKQFEKISICGETIWIVSGIVSVLGTMIVGIGVSHVFRPLFQAKYCFPVSAVAYVILGFCISKLIYRRNFFIIFIIVLLISTLPDYISIYQSDRALDADTAEILRTAMPSSDAVIYTNIPSYGLFDYYYPQASTTYGEGYVDALGINSEIWVFWTEEFEFNQEIERHGYNVTKCYEGNFPNGLYCYVYVILRE